jgi:hypothetical protein
MCRFDNADSKLLSKVDNTKMLKTLLRPSLRVSDQTKTLAGIPFRFLKFMVEFFPLDQGF